MVRPVRFIALLAVSLSAGAALAAPGPASARVPPPGQAFEAGVVIVDRMSDATFATLARRGAVGLLRPGYGPTTNRRRALAELVRGAEVNARLGGVPTGKPLINVHSAPVFQDCKHCIVLQLPPRGRPISNDRLYRIAVIGGGFHGLLTSPTTHIRGLVSIVDIAPLPQRVGSARALRRRRRALCLRHGHAAGVAGGQPVRPDAELALLGNRQPGGDSAPGAAARGGVPRAAPLRDRGLRRVRRL